DTTPPTIAITAPAANATVSGFVMLTAKASDNVSVAGVQFKLDGANLGAEHTAAPWALDWDTSTSGGTHVLTAVARDPSGNTVTAATVTVTIANLITAQDTNLVAAYGFGEGAGTTVNDSSGNGNTGTVANATWATGHFDGGLAFNGTNAMVSVPD